jgi:purine nucleosidase
MSKSMRAVAIASLVIATSLTALGQTKRKVLIDQDARGPATTDQQSMLMLLQSPDTETLGITIVSGDQWRDEEVAHPS